METATEILAFLARQALKCTEALLIYEMNPVLEVEDLRITFRQHNSMAEVVHGIRFSIHAGESVAIVGESGSGKSVTALALSRLLPAEPGCTVTGRVLLNGEDVMMFNKRRLRKHRGNGIAYVFQEPSTSLHPQLTIGDQIGEAIRVHQPQIARIRPAIVEALEEVGMPSPDALIKKYPHELSGGMQQRVVIAMALACRPSLLIADEPTTALDVTIQAQILALIKDLQSRHEMAVLLITHNFGIVDGFADRIIVMHRGDIVEQGDTAHVLRSPKNAYTRGLIGCIPRIDENRERLVTFNRAS